MYIDLEGTVSSPHTPFFQCWAEAGRKINHVSQFVNVAAILTALRLMHGLHTIPSKYLMKWFENFKIAITMKQFLCQQKSPALE